MSACPAASWIRAARVYCRKDNLLYMDMRDDSYELIPMASSMKPFEIAIFFSGLERSLASSKFNMRVDECRSVAYALKAFSGMEYGKFEETNLRDVPYETYLRYKDKLPENWAKRAEHWYTEFQRVEAGAEAWRDRCTGKLYRMDLQKITGSRNGNAGQSL